MRTISSSEFKSDTEKYLDLAVDEEVFIRRGENEIFVLTTESHLNQDADLERAVSADELLVGIESDLRQAYRKRQKR